jgi:hypothetical protein
MPANQDFANEPAALRPRREVLVRLGCGHALNSPFDAHLASERIPVEEESRARIRVELRTLPAHVAGEEHEAPLVRGLEEQHPHGWAAVRGRRRDRHRLRQPHDRPCLLEPASKLLERVLREVGATQLRHDAEPT